ncbi:MAG: hypothetical protein AAGI38_20320 [Bacteroidota bacterium]
MKLFQFKTLALLAAMMMLIVAGCNVDSDDEPEPDPSGGDLSQVQGTWVRVESNNPQNDGLEVTVTNDRGVVTAEPRNTFVIGSVKWNDITFATTNTYTYQELGSDGNYYEASMSVLSDSVLNLSVVSSGAGNIQKWIRKGTGGGGGSTQPITLDCNFFTSAQTLTNNASAIDYIVPNGCVLDVTAPMTVEPGVVIQFEENSGIGVYDQGSIKMIGTAAQPIVFQGAVDVRGYWRGVHIETNSFENQFNHVTIKNAGSNYVYCCNDIASVFLKGGKLSIQNTTLSSGEGHGLYANASAELATFEAVTITQHDDYPMSIAPNRMDELDGTGSDFTGNVDDFVELLNGDITQTVTMKKMNVPYLLNSTSLDVREPLTIEAGTEIEVPENGGIGVTGQGILSVNGTASQPVKIRGLQPSKGYWRGIHIETNSGSNRLSYMEISDAGSNYVYCCNTIASVYLDDGQCAFDHTTISNGKEYGIATKTDANFSNFNAVNITTHDKEPMRVSIIQAGQIDGLESDFSGNTRDFIEIYNSTADEVVTIEEINVPYRVANNVVIDIEERVNIKPGVDMAFSENAGIGVYSNGALNAVGTSSKKITFRGAENTNGYWRGIHIETNSTSNEIRHAIVDNAGSNYVYCCNQKANIMLKGGQATVANSSINSSGGCGIYVRSGGVLTESGNTFSGNTDGNICQ